MIDFLIPIAGLVTQYGGANSHMGIRYAEFDIHNNRMWSTNFNQIKSNTL